MRQKTPIHETCRAICDIDNDVHYVPAEQGTSSFCSIAHLTRYEWVFNNLDIEGKVILDFGCGCGYGAYLLSKRAKTVIGIDYSPHTIEYAINTYKSNNLEFLQLDACSADVKSVLGEKKFDFVISFDVIEHLERYFDYLENITYLLSKTGILLLGTPNRLELFDFGSKKAHDHYLQGYPFRVRNR